MSETERLFTQDEVNTIVQDRLHRDRSTRVTFEPRTYALDSPHSYFFDLQQIARDQQGLLYPESHQRMQRYGVEIATELDRGSPEGQYVERVLLSKTRTDHEDEHRARFREQRAFASGSGASASAGTSASVFVSPFFLNEQWAPFRGRARAFCDQCTLLPLPAYGMNIYVPYFSTTDAAASQTEGSAVTETDPTTALSSSVVVNIAGMLIITQQLQDRAWTGGGSIDAILYNQLCQQLEESIDSYTIQSAVSAGGSVAGNATFGTNTLANLYQDMALARENITDTTGTRLRPTHFFSTSDFYSYVTRQMDAQGRPMLQPWFAPGFPLANGADDGPNGNAHNLPKWSRFTGTILPAGVLWFTDDNIPASGSNTQLLTGSPEEAIILFEEPAAHLNVFPQYNANSLEIAVIVRKYCGFLARHSAGIQTIVGNAYTTSLK